MNIKDIAKNKDLRIKAGEYSLFYFALFYFPEEIKYKFAKFHKEMCKLLDDPNNTRLIFLMFRESAKTTLMKIKFIQNICYRKKRFQLFCCFDKRRAESNLFDIVRQLQTNPYILRDFGHLFVSQKKKTESTKKSIGEFITTNEVKCQAFSIGESPRGLVFGSADGSHRPDFWVLDDIDVLKVVENKDVIDKNWEWFNNELLGGVSADSHIVFLGNRVKQDGIIPRMEEKIEVPKDILRRGHGSHEDKNWKYLSVPIEIDDTPTWPDKYSIDKEENKVSIISKREELGTDAFYSQMLNIINRASKKFDISDIQIITERPREELNIFMVTDPAVSEKKQSDETVNIVVGVDNKNNFYVLDLFNERVKPKEAIDEIIRMQYKWQPINYGIESVAFQISMKYAIEDRMRETDRYFKITPLKSDRSKYERIMGLQPIVENKKLFIMRDIYNKNKLNHGENIVDQFDKFPSGKHDDIIDALAYTLQLAFPIYD